MDYDWHLQFIQMKDPTYKDVKDDTTWSMDKFNKYINKHVAPDKDLPKDWVHTHLMKHIKDITSYCFASVKNRFQCKVGYFELYGLDFMIDEDMKTYLIECNINPCLATNCEALKATVPKIVKEAIYLSVECFDKSRKGRPLTPLHSLQGFEVLYDGSGKHAGGRKSTGTLMQPQMHGTNKRSRSLSPVRRTRSLSPVKEVSHSNDMGLRPGNKHAVTPKATGTTSTATTETKGPTQIVIPLPLPPKEATLQKVVVESKGIKHSTTTTSGETIKEPAQVKQTSTINQKNATDNSRRSMFPSLLDKSPYSISANYHSEQVKLKMTHGGSMAGRSSAPGIARPVPGKKNKIRKDKQDDSEMPKNRGS